MNENQTAIVIGGIILIIGIILFSKSDSLSSVLLPSTTQLISIIIGVIGAVIAVLGGLKETNVI